MSAVDILVMPIASSSSFPSARIACVGGRT